MSATPNAHEGTAMAAVDARDMVAVEDAHGGLTVYFRDRPIRYRLGGEWYRAAAPPGRLAAAPVSGPRAAGRAEASRRPPAGRAPVS